MTKTESRNLEVKDLNSEHALELVRKLRPTLRFELADGAFFRVNARALPQKQPLGEILLVESFKDILARDVP